MDLRTSIFRLANTMEALSLAELKQMARDHTPKIKHYYIKSKSELIALMSTDDFPQHMIVEKMTIHDLRLEARNRGLTNVWNLRRNDLVQALYPSTDENDKNDNHAEKHNDP